jgi:hypothetical protein
VAGEEKGTADEAGSEEGKEEEKKGPPNIEDALARAREVLEDKGTMMAQEEGDGEKETGGDEDEEKEEGEEEGGEDAEGGDEGEGEGEEGEGADEGDGAGDDEGDGDDEVKAITVKVPGRQPEDEDIELEVEDQELAERIAHLKSGFMRGEEVRQREIQMNASEDAMEELSESFEVDPAAFVMKYTDEENLPAVVMSLLTDGNVWDKLKTQIDKLFADPQELRTVQAESKSARLEAAQKLTTRIKQRKENQETGAKLRDAIDLMVPESMAEKARDILIADLTRDTSDHITRNKLVGLDVKDLVPILAERLESSGIDPLDARKAIQNGSRSRGKISTKKGPKKKPKTGQELVKASAKRKKVAAAPGPGKRAAPTQPTKLPAGQTIQERIAAAREHGLAALVPEK